MEQQMADVIQTHITSSDGGQTRDSRAAQTQRKEGLLEVNLKPLASVTETTHGSLC